MLYMAQVVSAKVVDDDLLAEYYAVVSIYLEHTFICLGHRHVHH